VVAAAAASAWGAKVRAGDFFPDTLKPPKADRVSGWLALAPAAAGLSKKG
jgi:hypothetical protein